MADIDEQNLLAEVRRESAYHSDFLPIEEAYFWSNSAEIEQLYLNDFIQQPGYTENVKLGSGPISLLIPFLKVFSPLPKNVGKQVGRQMAKTALKYSAYTLVNNPGVQIQMVCSVRLSTSNKFNERRIEELTKDAVVFNVRYQLGRNFNWEQFQSALARFLMSRSAANAKTIKIAFWDRDLAWIRALDKTGDDLVLSNMFSLGLSLVELCQNADVIALEKRTMTPEEQIRQKEMHSLPATPEEISRINSILSGSSDPL